MVRLQALKLEAQNLEQVGPPARVQGVGVRGSPDCIHFALVEKSMEVDPPMFEKCVDVHLLCSNVCRLLACASKAYF